MCPNWVFAAFFVRCQADPAPQPLAVASAVAAWVERLLKAAPRSDASRNLLQRFLGVPGGHNSPGRAREVSRFMGSGCGAEVQGLCLCGMGFLQQASLQTSGWEERQILG